MSTTRKLKSGNWQCRVYSHTGSDGKQYYESFTAPTKQEAEMMATKFKAKADRDRTSNITIKEAVDKYLEANKAVLSPSTYLNYTKDAKSFKSIEHIRVRKVNSNDIQRFISELTELGLAPKTVRNRYGLLRSSLAFSGHDCDFRIHLPSVQKKQQNAPENKEIMALYNNAPKELQIAIMLASRHSLRRGEISGLTYGDLKGNVLYVHTDMVSSPEGWVHKEIPKTDASNRNVYLSEEETQLIGHGQKNEYIVPLTPGAIDMQFYRLKKKLGLEHIRFHDLRVYFASISAVMGIPEVYTAHHGGWREGSTVLKKHYQKPISSIDEGYAKKMNDYFKNMAQNMD
jgi:integrase